MWLGFLGKAYRQPRPAPEGLESAIARLNALAPAAGIRVRRVGPAELVLQDAVSNTGVVFDTAARSYQLTGVPETVRSSLGVGDWAPGMSNYEYGGIGQIRATLLAGHGVQQSIMATLEPATGRLELSPTDNTGQFTYDQLTLFGWHRTMTRRAVVLMSLIAVVLVIAAMATIAGVSYWVIHSRMYWLIPVVVGVWCWPLIKRRFSRR